MAHRATALRVQSALGRSLVCAASVALLALTGCSRASVGSFVWLDDLPKVQIGSPQDPYAIGPNDVLSLQVFGHAEMSGPIRVRGDGNLTVALLGDVLAAGKSPVELAKEIARELEAKNLVNAPRVTVVLDAVAPIKVSVIGEVKTPGLYTLEAGAGLAEALAISGGFTEFAHRDRLFIIRRTPELVRIRFRYADLTSATGAALTFRLKAGDTMLVQ